MGSSTSGSLPAGLNAQLDQLDEKKDPATDDVKTVKSGADSGKAVDTTTKEPKYSIVRRFFAFIFVWLINAAFIVLPGALDSLKQNHARTVEILMHSIRNIPLYVPLLPFIVFHFSFPPPPPPKGPLLFNLISGLFCLVGIIGIGVVSWEYAHDHDWLFHEFYRPVASGGLFGVLSTIVTIYGAHEGKYSPSSIATLAAMGAITIIFGLLALNSCRHIQRPKVTQSPT
ncbi:hypothetical protein BJV78DRAFT_1280068 [Lactifluus subvellereus]|nr:hypothetical protein BJV78DRAFT_1280068 [Lactifluus subvellereus]